MTGEERVAARIEARAAVRRAARRLAAEASAQAARDAALIAAHGDPRTGGLTYTELAEAAGLSRGRVIQIVQGRSAYSRERMARAGKATE